VAVNGFQEADHIPHEVGPEMHLPAQDDHPQRQWDDIPQHKLDRMGSLSSNADSLDVLVVDFVDVGVEPGVVEEFVGMMEEEVFTDHAEGD